MQPMKRLAPFLLALAAAAATAQPIDATTRRQVVDEVVRQLQARYVFPEVARQVATALQGPARRWDVDSDGPGFARALTDELQALTRDKHLRVSHSEAPVPDPRPDQGLAEAEIERYKRSAVASNFGVERVERLPGNIGYLELRSFTSAEWAGDAIAAAMSLLSRTEALIVDLRRNGGGDPATVALLSSYLFERKTHLNDLYFRPSDRTTQFWTHDWVPGTRFGGSKPVYVLTSKRTFSGAEEFSYNLKTHKRATLIGETTGGGAHPGEQRKVGSHFRAFIPTGRAINPITKTNWEGTGVEPDVKVDAADALRVAQLRALAPLLARTTEAADRKGLQERIAELEKQP